MRKIFLCFFLMLFPALTQAQTIIDLKPGGGVRSKTVEDYKEEMKMAERLREDSVTYVDHLRRAFNALHADSLNEAENLLNAALKLRPTAPGNHIVHYNLALISLARGKGTEALRILTAVLKDHPDYADARMTRAEVYLQQGRAREAISDADAVLAQLGDEKTLVQERMQMHFVRAAARYQLHLYADARADLLSVLKENPRHENALVLEALTLLKIGQPKEALNRLNLIVGMFPESVDALVTRAQVESELKMYVPARADYDKLIEKFPNESDYYVERARILIRLGEHYAARRDLDRAVELGVPRGVVQALYNLTKK